MPPDRRSTDNLSRSVGPSIDKEPLFVSHIVSAIFELPRMVSEFEVEELTSCMSKTSESSSIRIRIWKRQSSGVWEQS